MHVSSALVAIVLGLAISSGVHAESLMETYELALKNDATWAAKRAKYRADKEGVNQAFSTLLPQANLSASYANQKYNGSTLTTENIFDESDLERCERFSQAANNLGPGQGFNDISSAASTLGGCTNLLSSLSRIGNSKTSQTYTAKRYGINVVQPLLRMDRWHNYRQAEKLQSSSQAELAYEQQNLIVRVAETYFGVLRAQETLRLAVTEENSIKTQLAEIKNRYKLGLLRDTDLFEAQGSFDMARAARIRAEGEVDNIKETLRVLTQQETVLVNPLPAKLPIIPAQPEDPAQWVAFAKQNNYRVVAGKYIVASADSNKRSKKSGHLPTVDFFLDYSKSDVGGGFTPSSDTRAIGINVNVPLYSGGYVSSQTKQANFKLEEAKNNLIAAQRAAAMEASQYHRRISTGVASVNAHKRAIKSNNSAFESIKSGYNEGVRNLTELLTAQRRVFTARKDYIVSRYDYILDTLRLKRAAGLLTVQDLDVLNGWLSNATLSDDNINSIDVDTEVDPLTPNDLPVAPPKEPYKPKREGAKSLFEAIQNLRNK